MVGHAPNHVRSSATYDLSVVIPVRNGAATIGAQLGAILAQTGGGRGEIIVADNGSTDNLKEVLAEFSMADWPIVVVNASHRVGINVARNAGARLARADFVAFCDSDDVVGSNWVSAVLGECVKSPLFGGPLEFEMLNTRGTLDRSVLWMDQPVIFGVACAYGANFGCSKHLWRELGGFDESIVIGFDEIEFFVRAHIHGYIRSWHNGVVHYRLRDTLAGRMKQAYGYGLCHPYVERTAHRIYGRDQVTDVGQRLGEIAKGTFRVVRPRTSVAHRHQALRQLSYSLGQFVGERRMQRTALEEAPKRN